MGQGLVDTYSRPPLLKTTTIAYDGGGARACRLASPCCCAAALGSRGRRARNVLDRSRRPPHCSARGSEGSEGPESPESSRSLSTVEPRSRAEGARVEGGPGAPPLVNEGRIEGVDTEDATSEGVRVKQEAEPDTYIENGHVQSFAKEPLARSLAVAQASAHVAAPVAAVAPVAPTGAGW